VRVDVPGMQKEDFNTSIEENILYLNGETRYARESHDSTCHVMECPYASFQRSIPLPRNVDVDSAQASYRKGVLNIRLPKLVSDNSKSIRLS